MTRRKKQTARSRRRHVRRLGAVQGLEPRLMLTTISVTTTADVIDANDGVTSLREAVIQSNNTTSGDVTINLPSGVFGLTRSQGGEEFAQTGDLDIRRSVTIVGNAPQNSLADFTIIDGLEDTVIFDILGSGRIDVTFENLTLVNGRGRGGAIRALPNGGTVEVNNSILSHNEFRGAGSDDALGGAIFINGGTLILDNTDVEQNTAKGSRGAADSADNNVDQGGDGTQARGGGVYAINTDVLVRNGSNIRWNEARGGDGGTGEINGGNAEAGIGGGIYHNGGTLTIINSSVYGNLAAGGAGGNANENDGGNGGNAFGGGIAVRAETSVVTITSSLIYDNRANASRGGHARRDDNQHGDGGEGGNARGGGIYTIAPELIITDSEFGENFARGGAGGDSTRSVAADGGTATGGAIDVDTGATTVRIVGSLDFQGEVDLENPDLSTATYTTSFIGNQAIGGDGGVKRETTEGGADAGDGDYGRGGAIRTAGGTLEVDGVLFLENVAQGGFGGAGDVYLEDSDSELRAGTHGGDNGDASGGAIYTASDLTLSASSLVGNIAAGGGIRTETEGASVGAETEARVAGGQGGVGRDGLGLAGGDGGNAAGGAVFVDDADATITDSGLTSNSVIGGIGGQGGTAIGITESTEDRGGRGGDGGDAKGGAVAAVLSSANEVTMNASILAGNNVIAGQGGFGGFGAFVGNTVVGGDYSRGGNGGVGGDALGGGLYIENLGSSASDAEVALDGLVISGNRVVGGDGGDAGHGGSGGKRSVGANSQGTIITSQGGNGGNGGRGGDASGGGVALRSTVATITDTTIDANVVSSGWGGEGGLGGSENLIGSLFGFPLKFLTLSGTFQALRGGHGGDGGDAGDASGGGVDVAGGSLDLTTSTIYNNIVLAGDGGMGGIGGVGELRGGDGGDGGDAGEAIGGGVNNDGAVLVVTASTIAGNVINAGSGGQAGDGARAKNFGTFTVEEELTYQRAAARLPVLDTAGEFFTGTSTVVLSADGAAFDPSLSEFTVDDPDLALGDTAIDVLNDGAVGAAIAVGTGIGLGAAGAAAQVAVMSTATITFGSAAAAGGATVGGLVAVSALPVAGVAGLAAVGVVVGVKIIVALSSGASFADAVDFAIDPPDTGSGPNLAVLFGGGIDGDDDEEQEIIESNVLGDGSNGSEGQAGRLAGKGIAGAVTLSRSLIADNAARRRTITAELMPVEPGELMIVIGGGFNLQGHVEVDQQVVEITGVADIEGETLNSDNTNLIGSATFINTSDLQGTPNSPLDPMLQQGLGAHSAGTPTLALLAGSPARDAVSVSGSATSQNEFVSTGTTEIGAWAGPAAPALVGDFNADGSVDAADYTVWRDALGDTVTPYSGADADGDGQIDVDDYQTWKANFGNRLAQPLTGDFNGDGAVDTADFTVWRDTLGDSVTPFTGADADGDGEITAADYEAWRENFGATASAATPFTAAAASQSLSTAPEYSTAPAISVASGATNSDKDDAFSDLAATGEASMPPVTLPTQAGSRSESPAEATPHLSSAPFGLGDHLLLLARDANFEIEATQAGVSAASDDQREPSEEAAEEAFASTAWRDNFFSHPPGQLQRK
ncbi:MAG: dockerin type I domain-containing protein [Planctomycetota bacterium]